MSPLHDPTPRRRWFAELLRPAAATVATAVASSLVGSDRAEASPIRTAFKNVEPNARRGVSIRNGGFITLQATLHDGQRGIPNQRINFYVTINNRQVSVGSALTNGDGQASVRPQIIVPGLVGRNWVPVSWVPEFLGNGPYGRAQNNLLGGGFRVTP